ncbi:MAG: flagellar basal-body rod protein FlgG [Proteobacteria bacterium]|nr:flagellar basal-body rod protein FlgG [Pseudomonadota bacterium]
MLTSLRTAATGMHAQQTNVDVISNNLANVNTTGYKASRVAFNDLVYQDTAVAGAESSSSGTVLPTGSQIGLGVRVNSVYKIHSQGSMNNTSSPFDMAIQGDGFFEINLPSGETAYTRDGSFQLDANGSFVNSLGYQLSPAISVPQGSTAVTISNTGVASAKINGSTTNIGQITISTFTNPAGLESLGDNLFSETIASGPATTGNAGDSGYGTVLQGFLEASNVDSITSVTDLITAQRAYELNSKVITTADQMMEKVSQL